MSILKEYLERISNNQIDLEAELRNIISEYNKIRKTNLLVYVSNFNPQVPSLINIQDYYYLKDLIDEVPKGYYVNDTEINTIDKCYPGCRTCSKG